MQIRRNLLIMVFETSSICDINIYGISRMNWQLASVSLRFDQENFTSSGEKGKIVLQFDFIFPKLRMMDDVKLR